MEEQGARFEMPVPGGTVTLPAPAEDWGYPQASAPPAPTGPRVPRRERWLDLPDEYGAAGMKIKVWVNYPTRYGNAIFNADEQAAALARIDPEDEYAETRKREVTEQFKQERLAALSKIVVEHNGWLDDDGQPFPPADTEAFWDAISNELALTIFALLGQEIGVLPNSVGAPRRRGR